MSERQATTAEILARIRQAKEVESFTPQAVVELHVNGEHPRHFTASIENDVYDKLMLKLRKEAKERQVSVSFVLNEFLSQNL